MSSQRDGYGWMAQGTKGVFGARTLYPELYGKGTNYKLPYAEDVNDNSVRFGKVTRVVGAAMFHGRVSTNQKNLLNTHPIERDGNFIIHNGVVTHHGEKYDMTTTNDTEHVLFNFLTGGIKQVATNLTGYYAVGIIDKEGNSHIFKDSIANLHVAWSNVLESPVFATTPELVAKVGKYIGENLKAAVVADDTYVMFNSKGKLIKQESFDSRGYDDYSASHSRSSLGYDLIDRSYSRTHDDDWKAPSNIRWKGDDMNFDYNTEADIYNALSDEYLDELEYMDDSYMIFMGSRELTLKEFLNLNVSEQVECDVIRSDNTRVKFFKESA